MPHSQMKLPTIYDLANYQQLMPHS